MSTHAQQLCASSRAQDPCDFVLFHLWYVAFTLTLASWCKMEGVSAAIMSPFQGGGRRKRVWVSFKKPFQKLHPELTIFQKLLVSPVSMALSYWINSA